MGNSTKDNLYTYIHDLEIEFYIENEIFSLLFLVLFCFLNKHTYVPRTYFFIAYIPCACMKLGQTDRQTDRLTD